MYVWVNYAPRRCEKVSNCYFLVQKWTKPDWLLVTVTESGSRTPQDSVKEIVNSTGRSGALQKELFYLHIFTNSKKKAAYLFFLFLGSYLSFFDGLQGMTAPAFTFKASRSLHTQAFY